MHYNKHKHKQGLATTKTTGIGSFQPFLDAAAQTGEATRLADVAETQLGTAGSTLGGVPLGANAFQQDIQQFMSPYQSQVIDASLGRI